MHGDMIGDWDETDNNAAFDWAPLAVYIPMDRRQALARGVALPDRTRGAALFADVSGFTPLTEALVQELGRQRGAEELTRQLNRVYTALVNHVHRYRGSVISFSGDAITCWFDGDEGIRATACALAMQQEMRNFAQVQTPAGTTVSLAIKVGVTVGPVRRFLVGDPDIQTIDALAGATLDDVAAAERQAEKGEVVLGPTAVALLERYVTIVDWRQDEQGHRYAVVDGIAISITLSAPWPSIALADLAGAQLRPWLLPPVYDRLLQTGQQAYLAELRPAVTLFLRFGGLDYDGDDEAGPKLDAYMRWVQNVLGRYEGYLLQLTVGDKGSYLYAAFGAPIAHDDDPVRAVAAAIELCSSPPEFDFIGAVQIGISQGRMRTGAYGGETRRTYGVLGDEVNTSARLMGKAAPGQILVSPQIVQAAARSYLFKELGAFVLKGKAEPLLVSEVIGRHEASAKRPSTLYANPLVGREEDLKRLMERLALTVNGQGQVVQLEGVTGIGKSHLAAEFAERALKAGFRVVTGACLSTSQGTPYYPWRPIFGTFFDLTEEVAAGESLATITERQINKVEELVWQTNPDWQLRLPLLGDLLGLPIPENTATAAFDPRLRQEALFALAAEIMRSWAEKQPLLILVDDIQWMDEASLGLTLDLSRSIVASPVLLLFVHRPALRTDVLHTADFAQLSHYHYLNLNELSAEGVTALIRNRLRGNVSPLALSLIQMQAQGNPFFVEELGNTLLESGQLYSGSDGTWTLSDRLVTALREANCLVRQNGEWVLAESVSLSAADLGIPDSIHGIVLSRIDRLPESHKLTLKVASVIGRTFEFSLLNHAHPAHLAAAVLQDQVGNIEQRDFVRLEIPPPQLAYMFKHNTTQEVTYDTLLFAQRRVLHRTVALWYEVTYGQAETGAESRLAPYFSLLAYHWRQAEDVAKERYYARLAGEQAAAQFANEEAIAYFSRALDLTAAHDWEGRYSLLLGREAVYGLMGQREAQAADLIQLQVLADKIDQPQRRTEIALRYAKYYEAISDFSAALMAAQQTVQWADACGDSARKIEGLTVWGQAHWRRGNFEEARDKLTQALSLAQKEGTGSGEATCMHQLGTVFYITGDREAAREHLEKALTIRRELGDLRGEAGSLNNLAAVYHGLNDFARAMACSEQALAIYQAIGNRRDEAIALNNLGAMNHTLGEFETARGYHERALVISRTLSDRQGESVAANNLGWVLHHLGDEAAARYYCQQALAIREAIGDKRGQGYSLSYLGVILEGLDELAEAAAAYEKALQLRREIGQAAAAIDDLAGLASVALKQGSLVQATHYAEEIWQWLEEHGVQGVIHPLQVYLTIGDVWQANGRQAEAGAILTQAYELLQEQAARFTNEEIRRAFLENVPLHREVLARAGKAG
jgi:predicted ATPase/class 3 adenylate cyclase